MSVESKPGDPLRTDEILHTILSDMGDALIVADQSGNFLLFNPAAERMFGNPAGGVSPEEWPKRFGLFMADKVTPFPSDQLPLVRSIRGEYVNNQELFVRNEQVPQGLW